MITQDDTNKLFDIVTEVGVTTAIDLLENMRGGVKNYNGKFIDGFDYAIKALQKTNEIMKGREGSNAENHETE